MQTEPAEPPVPPPLVSGVSIFLKPQRRRRLIVHFPSATPPLMSEVAGMYKSLNKATRCLCSCSVSRCCQGSWLCPDGPGAPARVAVTVGRGGGGGEGSYRRTSARTMSLADLQRGHSGSRSPEIRFRRGCLLGLGPRDGAAQGLQGLPPFPARSEVLPPGLRADRPFLCGTCSLAGIGVPTAAPREPSVPQLWKPWGAPRAVRWLPGLWVRGLLRDVGRPEQGHGTGLWASAQPRCLGRTPTGSWG